MRKMKIIKDWKLVIRGEICRKAHISEYINGEFKIDTGYIQDMKFYKSYRACEKYLLKNGYIPMLKNDFEIEI